MTMTFALAAPCASFSARAADAGDIVVVSTKGDVHFTINGAARELRAGAVLEPPATVRTGQDGAVELKQGATTLSVGPDTLLEFPALEARGAPIDRLVQPRGNVFYDIGKRNGRKLRVETPYLVGVVKGTQFNVAAREDATTISLFEGLLEVRATDDSDVVDLKAGEIASRKRGDKSITVLKMNGEKAPPTSRPTSGGGNGATPPAPSPATTPNAPRDPVAIDGSDSRPGGVLADDVSRPGLPVSAGVEVTRDDGQVSLGIDVRANSISLSVTPEVELGAGGASVEVSVGAAAGDVADVGVSAAVDLTPAGASANVDLGAAAGVGDVAADVGASAAVDLTPAGASASVDLGATAGVGDVAVDVGASAAVDVGTTVEAAADVAVDTGLVAADAAAAVDTGAGSVDLGLGVAGVDIGLGLDLGLDDATAQPDTDETETTAPPVVDIDVGGLLDSLLRRPGRR